MYIQLVLASRYLLGRRLRTSLTTLAVAFAVLVIFGMNAILPTMLRAFTANVLTASGQVDLTITLKTGESFAPSVLSKVKSEPSLSAVAGSLIRTVNIPDGFFPKDAQVGAVTLTGIDAKSAQLLHNYTVTEGRMLRAEDEDAAVIAQSLADTLRISAGSKLRLPTTEGEAKLTVVGIRRARTLPGSEEVLVTLAEAQKLLALPNRINTIEANLQATDEASRSAIEGSILGKLGDNYESGSLAGGGEIMAAMRNAQAIFSLFGFLALFMGGFIIFNTFRTVVAERRHDIGMLRAIGAGRGAIAGIFMIEGLLQGTIGTLVGMALGYLLALGSMALLDPIMVQYIHISMGAPVITVGLVVTTALLGIGVTLLAGLLPAISASRLTPLEALRPEVKDASKRRAGAGFYIGLLLICLAAVALIAGNVSLAGLGALLVLVGLVLVAPVLVGPLASLFGGLLSAVIARQGTGMLAEGNLERQPGRAAVTASTTMVGLAIIVTAAGAISSMNSFLIVVLGKTLGSDYMLVPPSVGVWSSNIGANSGLADRLRAVPGVDAVSTIRFAMSQSDGKTVSVLGIDPVVFPQVAGLNFQQGDADTAFAALDVGRTLIANGPLASQLGLGAGDTMRLSTPTGSQEYTIVAVAGDYLNAKIPSAYISQRLVRQDFRKTDDVFVQVNLADGARAVDVEARLKSIVTDYPQFKLISRQVYQDQTKQAVDAALIMYTFILAALAIPSLIALLNTLAIGVIERTREIGMLRAVGATRSQVRRMVLAEALLLAAVGTVLGLIAGLYLSYVSVLGLGASGYPLAYSFPVWGLVAAAAIGLGFGALAAVIPARQAAGLEIVRALQYE